MKKMLVAGLTLLSLNSFAQSYMVLGNGVTLTVDKAGFVYDFKQFFLPYQIQVNGGQFLVADGMLNTVDSAGFLYKKDLSVEEVKGKGLNYFINEDNHLYTIDEKGFFYKFDKDKSAFKKASTFGGNFFIVKEDEKKKIASLYTINSKGNYFKLAVQGLNPWDISIVGGTWFVDKAGVVHTVNKDGNVFAKADMKVGGIVRKGGNFFVDNTNKVFTVSEEGLLVLPGLPMSFNLNNIVKVGANYLIDIDGKVFSVDSAGNVNERTINEHDIRNVKVLSI